MIILGIDPGTATIGYGIIRVPDDLLSREFNYDLNLVDYGFVSTSKDEVMPRRLVKLYHEIGAVIDKFKPDIIVLEMLFFGANTKTAIAVGQARGVIMLCAGERNITIQEYTGPQVKLMVAGGGRADKKMVHEGVRRFLANKPGKKVKELMQPMAGLKRRNKKFSDDAIDAIAIAICHVLKIVAK